MLISQQKTKEKDLFFGDSSAGSANGTKIQLVSRDVSGNDLPHGIKMTQNLMDHLNKISRWVNKKWDYTILITGYMGVGKSHVAQKCALYLNHKFSLDDILFTPAQFIKWIDKAPKGSVCVFDEADALSDHHASAVIKMLIRQSKRIRTKQLTVFLVTPTFSDMNKFFAWRTRMLIHCTLGRNQGPDDRGWFHLFHGQDLIMDLYGDLKKFGERDRTYKRARSTLRLQFLGVDEIPDEEWFINKEAYEDKKEQGRIEFEQADINENSQAFIAGRDKVIAALVNNKDKLKLTQDKIAFMLGVSPSIVSRARLKQEVKQQYE